jgi:Zn-dependent protease
LLAAKPVPFNPNRVRYGEYGAALVGIAGPFTNLFLALLGALILRTIAVDVTSLLVNFLLTFVRINVALFVFNMIPIPPLDGSRLIYALVPESVQQVMASMERYGIMLVFTLLIAVPAFSILLLNLDSAVLKVLL